MSYILPLFLCYFFAQTGFLNIIRKSGNYVKKRYDYTAAQRPQRTCADGLDFELLLKQSEKESKPDIKLLSADDDILKLFNNDFIDDKIQHSLTLYKCLKFLIPYGESFLHLKSNIQKLISVQYYNGNMPDYFKGNYCIRGGANGALILPAAVAAYCDYTGDLDFLKQNICYNQLCSKPLSNILPTVFCESVIDHVLKAIGGVSINSEGLIQTELPLGIFDGQPLNNIISSILYCISTEHFFDYTDYKTKLHYINRITDIRQAAAKKSLNLYRQNGDNLYYILYMLASSIKPVDFSQDIYSESGYKRMLYCISAIKSDRVDAIKIVKEFTNEKLSPLQHIILKKIILSGFFGINFKCGHLGVKPCMRGFKISFKREDSSVIIEAKDTFKGCLSVNGITLNNVDYINLRGYNKDIYITV